MAPTQSWGPAAGAIDVIGSYRFDDPDGRVGMRTFLFTAEGQGEALGMAVYDARWYIAPSNVRIRGGGWSLERVPVDRFELESDGPTTSTLRNDRFALTFFRRPQPGPASPMTLTATWPHADGPVVLATVE